MKDKHEYRIRVLPSDTLLTAYRGEALLDVLVRGGVFVTSPCGGRGRCGKCRVRLISGRVDGQAKDSDGCILSCKARITEDITVEPIERAIDITVTMRDVPDGQDVYAALDIGTTTLAAMLISTDGDTVAKASCLNPQAVLGADVLSRINACNEGKLEILKELVTKGSSELILKMCGGTRVKKLFVTANTVMLHILLGISPRSIGVYPFTPVFTEAKHRRGDELGLPVEEAVVLPSASGYIGSDVIAGAVYLNMHKGKETRLLLDLGTNGEMILAHGGKIYAASCAAGPALEGASIECGMGGTEGAISRIVYENGMLSFKTVNGAEPKGLCGSALIDLVSILVKEGVIDDTGAFDTESGSPLGNRLIGERFYITDRIYLSSGDVRQIQLAKAAISAGIEALLAETGISEDDISSFYIAGTLGEYMSPSSAEGIGLIPRGILKNASCVGNTSLLGAAAVAVGNVSVDTLSDFSGRVITVELSASEVFRERFIDNMYFPRGAK